VLGKPGVQRKKPPPEPGKHFMISPEVAERIRSDHVLLRDEARLVRELARTVGNRELLAHAESLERMVKNHVSLVEGVLEAVVPEEGSARTARERA
jgi:hypothetical protein